jgi:hypothetical protein
MEESAMTNNEKEFMLEEYRTLRKEILNKMDKQYNILSLGVGGITVIFGAIFSYKAYLLLFVLPFLIFANAFIYLTETRAIINAGKYIKELESKLYAADSMGWEHFLSKHKSRKKIYMLFEYAMDLIFLTLYSFCVVGAEVWYYYTPPYYLDWHWVLIARVMYIVIAVVWISIILKKAKE